MVACFDVFVDVVKESPGGVLPRIMVFAAADLQCVAFGVLLLFGVEAAINEAAQIGEYKAGETRSAENCAYDSRNDRFFSRRRSLQS